MLVLAGLILGGLSGLLARRVGIRWCRVDLAVVALFALVAVSAGHAADGRVALNLAWEWVGVGLCYLAVRWLTADAAETRDWLAAILAIGFALSLYGMYQVLIVHPEMRREYLADPAAALRQAGIPDDPIARRQFEDRILGSREPMATFGLANSLAVVLLVPLICVAAGMLAPARRRWVGSAIALGSAMLPVFVLTKGRAAYVGLAIGLVLLAKGLLRRGRQLAVAALVLSVLLASVGLALHLLGRVDPLVWNREVLSESVKSLQYRGEYFAGTWRILTREPGVWWTGLGPGNFSGPYLRHKLETASEAISDPHNLFLEVWTTAGLPALVALSAALILGLHTLFKAVPCPTAAPPEPAPRTFTRLAVWGAGGLVGAVLLRPDLGPFAVSANPLEGDFVRWALLGLGWLGGAWLAARIVHVLEERVLRLALGAGLVAMLTALLISGGIGYAPVASVFWTTLAVGLNLCGEGRCGQVRECSGRWMPALGLFGFAAIAGWFAGTMIPHGRAVEAVDRAERAIAQARQIMRSPVADPYRRAEPYYRAAAEQLRAATRLDRLAAYPWIRWAWLELENWEASGRPTDFSHLIWHRIEDQMTQAMTRPRNPNNAAVASTAVQMATRLLATPGWPESERVRIRWDRLAFARQAARLNPTSALAHAVHAEAAWSLVPATGLKAEGDAAAETALRLDRQTPHIDKKLPRDLRARLQQMLEPARPEA
ncbi:MAG: hypothetical protein KatS3mg108_3431 [Isosphaeraceae bacterium]|jgi:O-antigen ligase|nr:MAG: hypothetical protein KatS3mg108_3431 [Isosphaeraceae bacterium]